LFVNPLFGSTTLAQKNTFDRKRISDNPNPNLNSNPNLKHNNVFGLTKWRHFIKQVYRYQERSQGGPPPKLNCLALLRTNIKQVSGF